MKPAIYANFFMHPVILFYFHINPLSAKPLSEKSVFRL